MLAAPFIIFFLALSASFWERFLRVVAGRKAIKAVEEASRFRGAWLECSERNPNTVTDLAKFCKGITLLLDQQREEGSGSIPNAPVVS